MSEVDFEAFRHALTGGDPVKEAMLNALLERKKPRRPRTDEDREKDAARQRRARSRHVTRVTDAVTARDNDVTPLPPVPPSPPLALSPTPPFIPPLPVAEGPETVPSAPGKPLWVWEGQALGKWPPADFQNSNSRGNWVAGIHAYWVKCVGQVSIGQLGKELKGAYELYGFEKLKYMIWLYSEIKKAKKQAQNINWFAKEMALWAGEADTPLVNDGEWSPTMRLITAA